MKYGKKATSKKRNALISRSSMMGKRAGVSLIRLLFLSLLAIIVAGVFLSIGSVKGVIDNAPDVDEIDIMPLGYATFLYDEDGNQLRKLAAPSANRMPVSLDQIPEDLQHAVVAIEDERFYEHNGIDVRGILRAASKALGSGNFSEGASTITQQLLKNNVFTSWTSESTLLEKFTRKLQEQYLAVEVEKKYDKDVILENYLNTINLGAGSYGVQAAAHQYFNKDVWDLNLSESVTIAGITQNPSKYDPIENPESNQVRRIEVLDHMLDQGYIDQTQYDEALNDNVYARISEAQSVSSTTRNTVYSYFEDELIDQVINDLMSVKGYTKTQATNLVYSGGLKITTTQDPDIQDILDEEYSNPDNYPANTQYALDYALTIQLPDGTQNNYSKEMLRIYFQETEPSFSLLFNSAEDGQTYVDQYKAAMIAETGGEVIAERVNFAPQPQSSMSIIDQHTGYVKAIIGGRGEKTASLTLNRATDTTRQPGSTFKIVSTYAPALNEKNMTLATTILDEEYTYPNGAPVNNASRSHYGYVSIRTAIQNSINVVAVKCLEEVTPELGLQYLDNFGFTTLAHGTEADTDADGTVWTDANLPTALGGITYGVTNVELCAAYASIANGGQYIKPIYYTQIIDHNGNVLIDNTSVSRTVLKEATAWLLTSAMEDVVKYGTGRACQLDNMPVAGKTGTTESYNDLWFVGYTPYYTCAVWSGYDNNEKLPGDAQNFHKNMWRTVMNRIHSTLPTVEFEMPASVTQATVCSETGLLASYSCPSVTEYFDTSTLPDEYCDGSSHWYSYDETEEQYDEYGNLVIYDENGNETTTDSTTDPTENTETDSEIPADYDYYDDYSNTDIYYEDNGFVYYGDEDFAYDQYEY